MAVSRAVVEAVLVVVSLGVYVAYHVWLLGIRGRGHKVQPEFHDFFAAGKLARSIWAETCARDEKDAILGVQQARNAMSACSYLATIAAVLATAGITVILDSSKTERMAELAIRDPILRHAEGPPLAAPVAILGLALGTLYGAFVCFAQSVRLYVHVGFYIRAVPSKWNPGLLHVTEAKKVAVKAGMAFTVGLRLFYFFIPLVLWTIGVTALLFSSLAMTMCLMYMDWFEAPTPPGLEDQLAEQDVERGDGGDGGGAPSSKDQLQTGDAAAAAAAAGAAGAAAEEAAPGPALRTMGSGSSCLSSRHVFGGSSSSVVQQGDGSAASVQGGGAAGGQQRGRGGSDRDLQAMSYSMV